MLSARVCGCGRRGLWWGLAAGAALLAVALVLRWAAFPAILTAKIKQAVQLHDGSPAMERFVQLPQPLLYKVYLFNVTNPDEVEQGAKPVLQQVGPYVYEEWRRRRDVTRMANGSLDYRLETTYHFSPERSPGLSEDDEFTYLNVVMVGIVVQVSEDYSSLLSMVEPVLSELVPGGAQLFQRASARQLLWSGVPTVDCRGNLSAVATLACGALPSLLPATVQQTEPGVYVFSFFGFKNGTSKQWWRVDSGVEDVRTLGSVISYDNSSRLKVWSPSNSPCNEIRGTDSTLFPPFITPNDTIYIFAHDICRSMHAEYEGEQDVSGVHGLRFVASGSLLRRGGPNACTCPDGRCLATGAISVRECFRAPIAVSFPHFYQASPEYLQYAEGLSPNKELHETFVVIEPETGTPLVGAKRLQFNMKAVRVSQVPALRNVSDGLFPLLWVEEGVELEEKQLSQVRALYVARASMGGVAWAVLAVGVAALLFCAVRLAKARVAERNRSLSLEKGVTAGGKLSVPTLGAAYPESATKRPSPPAAAPAASAAPAAPVDATHF
ncbi:sensory neuron membrane protein 2-like [Schistocerca gregaria]|uniref:sensory neuron membrane protein 2-like n=1 Tax=Schistocerca gregaria TaxID=7010 RepID=UPI00211EBEE0|nr:sensory neuron membrane protein 2-like [Schistocerca gregaria]